MTSDTTSPGLLRTPPDFIRRDAESAISRLEVLLEVAWVGLRVEDTPVANHARTTLRVITTNAINLLTRPEPSLITWDSLLKASDSRKASASKHAANQILTTKFQRVMRCVLGLAVADRALHEFAYLFARPTPPPGESNRRLGVTKGKVPGVIGLALVDSADAPIAAMRELLEGSRDSPSHRDYDPERASAFAKEVGLKSLPKSLSEEVAALLGDERDARQEATEILSTSDMDAHGVDLRKLLPYGFPSTVVATSLRVPREGRHTETCFVGTDDELVSTLVDQGWDVVLQAAELVGPDAALRPIDIAARCGMHAPAVRQFNPSYLEQVNETSLLIKTGRAIVPDTTIYWTATQTIDEKQICLVGRNHSTSASQQIFRVGGLGNEDRQARTLSLIEVALRHHPLFVRPPGKNEPERRGALHAQIEAIQPMRLGGRRLPVQRMAMSIVGTAYALLLSSRQARP